MIVRRRTKGGKSTMNDMYLKNRMEKLEYAGLNWLEVQRKFDISRISDRIIEN